MAEGYRQNGKWLMTDNRPSSWTNSFIVTLTSGLTALASAAEKARGQDVAPANVHKRIAS